MPDLSTRTKRRGLRKSDRPVWVRIARGRAVGYRRNTDGPGSWCARVYVGGDDGSPYRETTFATADDDEEADGETILDYGQAVQWARAWDPSDGRPAGPPRENTVGEACRHYLDWYREHRRSHERVRYTVKAHVLPRLGDVELEDLTAERLRRWHRRIANSPVRLRTKKGAKERNTRELKTEEDRRKRKVTANRVLSILRAALNRAVKKGPFVGDPTTWSTERVEPYRNVDRPRTRVLEREEIKRLMNACKGDFRALVAGALYTGARYGELARMRVEDLRPDLPGIHIPESKSGNPRTIFLNSEGAGFFEGITAGRGGDELVFTRKGDSWGKSQAQRPIRKACKAGKITPRVKFHELRHTYASLYLMAGGGLPDLAKQLGHADTRMVERHYGHLAEQWRADRAQEFAPSLGLDSGKVRALRKSRKEAKGGTE